MGDWESIFKKRGRVFAEPQQQMLKVIRILKRKGVKRVLDLGCGSGRHTVLLAKEGFTVSAMDVSPEAVKLTRRWLRQEHLKAGTKVASCYKRFPFPNDFFDALISTQVIHHNFHDKVRFCISEIERVLKPGGILFVTVPAGKYRRPASKAARPEPHTYIPLAGDEKGLPHFSYTRALLEKDFAAFDIMSLRKDQNAHWCLLGKRRASSSA